MGSLRRVLDPIEKSMNLRACFPPLQYLFLTACAAWLLPSAELHADAVVYTDGRRQEVREVRGVVGGTLNIVVEAGSIGVPLATVKEVQMAVPPEVAQVQKAVASKDYNKALSILAPLVGKFKGLPVEWAMQATAMLGGVYISLGEMPKAEAAYKDFQKSYAASGSLQSDVGMARVAVFNKKYDAVKPRLEAIAEAALKEKSISGANALAYSQAFLALGEIRENEGDLSGALAEYLRTVAVFYHDASAVAAAQERANSLISRKVTVP
jgi:hypothetical protein